MDGKAVFKEVLKYVNVKGLLVSLLLNQIVKPAVLELAATSENKLDDTLVALLLPQVEKQANEVLDKLLAELQKA